MYTGFEWDICGMKANLIPMMRLHIKKEHGWREFACNGCRKKINCHKNVKKHTRRAYERRNLSEKCRYKAEFTTEMKCHERNLCKFF